MNDAASRKKIRLGEVAGALAVDAKLIRNWIQGDRFDLLTDENRAAQKWREFSFFDVAHLAIAQQVIRYGFNVDEAHDFAGACLIRLLGPLANRATLGRMPGGALLSVAKGKSFYLVKFSTGDSRGILVPGDLEEFPVYPAAVRIDLWACIGSAFKSLEEMGHDPFESSHPREYSEEEAAALKAVLVDDDSDWSEELIGSMRQALDSRASEQ